MEATKEKKFTPGPWSIDTDINGSSAESAAYALNLIIETEDSHIAFVFDESPANARLMAASPEAYDLAVAVAEHFKDTDAPLGKMARDYLKLAEEGRAS